mgnify:FL=1
MVDLGNLVDQVSLAYDRNIIRSANTITARKNQDQVYKTFINNIIKQTIIDPRQTWAPGINGWYYANFVGGTWEDQLIEITNNNTVEYKEFSTGAGTLIPRVKQEMGFLIKDVNPPQYNMDYDGVSGRLRTISIATRVNLSTEFSVTWKETASGDVFKYHEFWMDYIEAHKKGFIPSLSSYKEDSYFIDVPYYNAMWVAVFKPFTYELICLIKLMGISPTSLPVQEFIGQRGQSQATTYNISYKVVDAIIQTFEGKPSGNFYQEFMTQQHSFFATNILDSLELNNQANLDQIKLFN